MAELIGVQRRSAGDGFGVEGDKPPLIRFGYPVHLLDGQRTASGTGGADGGVEPPVAERVAERVFIGRRYLERVAEVDDGFLLVRGQPYGVPNAAGGRARVLAP